MFGKQPLLRLSKLGLRQVCVTHWRLSLEHITFHWFLALASVKWEVKLGDF